ncbi:uncharacterized protein LOC114263216 [Camellia sinensis]|uniref:uncharacterized protein LOC114263216 n=1 Tax=Camellia sinensis TaxID=4442 RepID=UPI0010361ACD|nr:uncharacterized protein LOC114263216 [Camellia sinensis]
MKIMSWNVRGLGRLEKRRRVKQLIKEKRVDVVLFQETKSRDIDVPFVRSIWPWEKLEFMAANSDGSAGGLLSIWNPEVFSLSECCSNRNFLLLSGTLSSSFECVFLNIYAPNDVVQRAKLWDSILNVRSSFQKPWCMGGDYNEIRVPDERRGCTRSSKGMQDFNNFVDLLELMDLPMLGRKFTWCNSVDSDRWSRIDRFLLDPLWVETFSLKLWGLPRLVSDHYPLLLTEDEKNWGPKPFRFLNAWTLHPSFLSVVQKSWLDAQVQGWVGFRVKVKLCSLKAELKRWNSEVFGCVEDQLRKAEAELHELDLVAEMGTLDPHEVVRRSEVKNLVWSYRKKLDWIWFQKSRVNWAQNGDRNTRFFHIMASQRQNRNLVDSVVVEGVRVEDPALVKLEVLRFFSKAFSEDWPSRPKLSGSFVRINSAKVVEFLDPEFTLEEVWEAVKDCNGNKAPGPDGFNMMCIQKC